MTPTLLEKIKGLQYFAGLRDLKRILVEFLSTVTALETNSVVVGRYRFYGTEIPLNSPLTIGKKYRAVTSFEEDFSNVGQLPGDNSVYFIATAITPNIWISAPVYEITDTINIFYNDVDSLLELKSVSLNNSDIVITNSSFVIDKTYPSQSDGTSVQVIDSNTIRLQYEESGQPSSDPDASYNYFKIEVYN